MYQVINWLEATAGSYCWKLLLNEIQCKAFIQVNETGARVINEKKKDVNKFFVILKINKTKIKKTDI